MKRGGFVLVMALWSLAVTSQERFYSVIDSIVAHNLGREQRALQAEGALLEERVGQSVGGPEVELGYTADGKRGEPRRRSVEVKQELPTMGIFGTNRRLNRSLRRSSAQQLAYADLLLRREAEQKCMEWVYLSKREEELARRCQVARLVEQAEHQRMEKGEGNRIDYNNARLDFLRQSAELERVRSGLCAAAEELQTLNGGRPLSLAGVDYPARALPMDFEAWYAEKSGSAAELLLYQGEVECQKERVRWMKRRALPRLVAGYSYESAGGAGTSGVTLGIRFPLGQERRAIAAARQGSLAKQVAEREESNRLYHRAKEAYLRCQRLGEMRELLREELLASDQPQLIHKSLTMGHISLADYLLQLSVYYQAADRLLELEREIAEAMVLLYHL